MAHHGTHWWGLPGRGTMDGGMPADCPVIPDESVPMPFAFFLGAGSSSPLLGDAALPSFFF